MWHATAACLAMLCAACSATPPVEGGADAPVATNLYTGTQPVFAEMTRERGGSWVFTTVTASDSPGGTGFLVRLNDLAPAFDTRVAECVPQVYPETHRCSPTHPFRDRDTGMLDKIINGSIAVGTAGKMTELSQSYETAFDEAAFNRAVDEALLNTGLDRHRLINVVDTFASEVRLARAETAEMARHASDSRGRIDRIQLAIEPQVSGLTEYYEGDLDFTELVRLEAADSLDVSAIELNEQSILPCDARQCLLKAEKALAALRQEVASNTEQLAAIASPETSEYAVVCNDVADDEYLLELTCPETIVIRSDNVARLHVGATILARDFDTLLPTFELGDERLQILIDGESVTFSNVTDEYISISAKTVYYNSKTHTTPVQIDVPPGISVTQDVRDFVSPSIEIESSYRNMTPDKAEQASFRFGLAVRYRSASQAEEQSLHDVQTYNVGCVIRDRIDPGSCRPESVAEVERPRPVREERRSSTGKM